MMNEMKDVVVVDDNPALLCVLSEILKEHGYSVRMASDGFEALAVIRDRAPDILISDLNMPGMSGFELLSVVRRRFPTIAVIAMSGAYSSHIASPGIAADGFYAKGSTSIGGLLDILSKVEDEEVRQSRCQGRNKTRPVGRSKSRPVVGSKVVEYSGEEGRWSVAEAALLPRGAPGRGRVQRSEDEVRLRRLCLSR